MSDQDLPTYLRGHSLSNADLATTRGAALLKLCQSATADGRLSPDELEGLRQWLADGRITPEEGKDVHRRGGGGKGHADRG